MVEEQAGDQRWGEYAQRLLNGAFQWPRGGGNDDKAHPPIHPTRYSPGEPDWSNDKRQLYEFVVRSFLA